MPSGRHHRAARLVYGGSGRRSTESAGSPRRGVLIALGAVLAAILGFVVALSATGGHHHPASASTPTPSAPSSASATSTPAGRSTTSAPDSGARARFIPPGGGTLQAPVSAPKVGPAPSVPVRIQVPSVGIDGSPLEALKVLGNGTLQPPASFGVAGWFAQGTRPGAVGPAVIAGHVDSRTGPGIFLHLGATKVGAKIIVTTKTGQKYQFTVTDVHQYPKDKFPASVVYGPTPLAMLRLITCAGDFNQQTHHYVDNLVVSSVLDN